MRTDEEETRYLSEVMMAGAVHAALVMADIDVENATDDGLATPALWVKFLKSRYRITVTMDPQEADSARRATMNADDPLNELLSTTDAQEWARAFCEKFGGDEKLMLVWFANAIETGRSAGWKQAKEDIADSARRAT